MAEDYMSDAFLQGLDDVKPGLKSRNQKRKDRATKTAKIEPKHKRIKASEHEARTKGLATHISSSNIGFSMLQKMGYKEGMGLGKNGEELKYLCIFLTFIADVSRCWCYSPYTTDAQRRYDFSCGVLFM